ncbi:hydrogenase iron-sulfur subunit [Chloroflexota bacterium]
MSSPAKVVVFACNWDGLSCVESAAHAGLCYPASVKVVRVSCLSRVHLGLILKAFALGADGVMLLGCDTGECHYDIDSKGINQEYKKAQDVLNLIGVRSERLVLTRIPRGDGHGFVDRVNNLISQSGGIDKGNRVSECST